MKLFGLDFESTGLDTSTARVTEIGYALWENGPMLTGNAFLLDDGIRKELENPETLAMIKKVCGLTPEILEEYGLDAKGCFERLETIVSKYQPDFIVAHNGENYDKPLLYAELDRHGIAAPVLRSLPWLDTRYDIPFSVQPDSLRLNHLALDAGFINPFPHRALFDVLTMLKVLSNYDIQEVINFSRVPWVVVRALVSYDQRQLAKDARYSWEQIGNDKYPKCWVKKIKENKVEEEKANGKFQVSVI